MAATRNHPRRLAAAGAALALCLGAAACSSGGANSSTSGVLTVSTGYSGTFTPNFNPFSPNAFQATNGMIYEPLFLFNSLRAGDVKPWLATAYTWSQGGRQLHITVRHGATWSDGQAFSNKDVAFTFELATKNKALNQYGLPLVSATADGADGVTLTFSQPAYTKEYFILGKQLMLPQHVWQGIPDAQKTTVLNSHPVGTGPWTVKSVTGQAITLSARKDYYFTGLPHFREMRYLSFTGNSSSTTAITSGQIDWAGDFIPDVQKNYLAKNKKFALVNVPLAITFLVPNDERGATADVNVRKAISAALDRQFMNQSVYSGQAPVATPEALLQPNYSSVLDPSLAGASFETGQAAVDRYLTASGYAKGSDGYYAKNGKRLTLTVKVVSGWTDYVSLCQLAQQELKKAGIDLQVQPEAQATWLSDQATGNFDMLIGNYGYTPDPRAYYDEMTDSAVTAPIGTTENVGNYGRYRSAAMDDALRHLAQSNDPAQQKPWFYRVEQQFVKDMPLIPLLDSQNEQEFNGNHVTGFPTAGNPYAAPSVWLSPDCGWVAARLEPAK